MIRVNVMRGTFASSSVEAVEAHLKPWIERLATLRDEARRAVQDEWVDADKFLPMGSHEVLATDGENRFVAYYAEEQWWHLELDEPCDSQVLAWMELPDVTEC